MSSSFNLGLKNRYAPTGYEGENYSDYVIPSCGLEDVDKAIFNLFDKDIPLYYNLQGESKKIPVIFATGERFALLRRKKPIVDRNGAHVLPLISITRNSVDNVPQKGITNNQMFPHVITKRISKKDLEHRQNKNFEKLSNIDGQDLQNEDSDFSLKPKLDKNIIETIEMPPVKYFGASYEVTVWSTFTQQMNKILEAIMSAYTINPGQQFRIESDKGYHFSAFVDSSFSPDTNYADFTDAERYIKYSITIVATGYIIAPNIEGGKTALRSFLSAPEINFETFKEDISLEPHSIGGVFDPDPDAHIFDDLSTEETYTPAQRVAQNSSNNISELLDYDSSRGSAVHNVETKHESSLVAERGSDYRVKKINHIRNSEGKLIPVEVKSSQGQGETVYDSRMGEILFNISTNKE
jgi:hypothetical protein